MRRIIATVSLSLLCSGLLALGAPPKKSKPTVSLPVGTEATIVLVGDEFKRGATLGKAKVITEDSIVLVRSYEDLTERGKPGDAHYEFDKAIRNSDPDGIDVLLEKRWLVKVPIGVKVRVIEVDISGNDMICTNDYLATDNQGIRTVRIIEGESKGITVALPARNLRALGEAAPVEQAKPEAKKADPAKRAATLLGMAKSLEKLKKTPAALKAYQEIVSDYPATPAAKEAAERAKNLRNAK